MTDDVQQPTAADIIVERACRAMVTASRPMADPDKLTPAPRGSVGMVPIWRTYEHLARAALSSGIDALADQLGAEAGDEAKAARLWLRFYVQEISHG